jgi:hypothetical protein
MEAKNFRVTNLIYNDRIVNAIIFIGFDSVQLITPQGNNITARLELIKPIPLNKEWVEKLGGKTHEGTTYISVPNLKAELHFEFFGSEVVTTLKSQFSDLILDPIKYVHNLQNLFFALANDELKYEKQK